MYRTVNETLQVSNYCVVNSAALKLLYLGEAQIIAYCKRHSLPDSKIAFESFDYAS